MFICTLYLFFFPDSTYEQHHMMFVLPLVTSLSMLISRSTYVATSGVCKWHFYVLSIVNSAAMNTEVHVFFQIMVLSRNMPRCRIAGSYGSSIFSGFLNFLKNILTVLHSGNTSYIPTNSVGRFPFLHRFSSIYCL